MADVTRNYGINYLANTGQAKANIDGLSGSVRALAQLAGDATNEVSALALATQKAAPALKAAAAALSTLTAADKALLRGVAVAVGEIGDNLTFARHESEGLRQEFDRLGGKARVVGGVAATVGRVADNARNAGRNLNDVGEAIAAVGRRGGALTEIAADVEKVQRKGFGAKRNIEELNVALGNVGANAAPLQQAAAAAGQLGSNAAQARSALRGSAAASRSLGRGLIAVAGGMTALNAARRAATEIGGRINEWRSESKDKALAAVALQDTYREVANLQGKPAPDSETVAQALKLRIASGMTDADADRFLRRWYGSLPAGRDKGNIADGVADELQAVAGGLGVRTGMDSGTAGDLAASLANYGKVPTAAAGAGQLGVIVQRLNEGRGDLTPLANALLKTAGTTVGPRGSAFANLPELAAVLGVASNNATPSVAGTMIQQAMRGLSATGREDGYDDQLELHGITGSDDFLTRVRKIKPLIDHAEASGENPMDVLRGMGWGNITDRRAIVYFARNYGLLKRRMDATRAAAGPDGDFAGEGGATAAANRAFLDSAPAQGRRAAAMRDAADYARHSGDAELYQRRQASEADLIAHHGLDSLPKRIAGTILDGFGLLPALGFKSARDATIDLHAEKPIGGIPALGADGDDARAMLRKMDELIAETRQANQQRAALARPPMPRKRPEWGDRR